MHLSGRIELTTGLFTATGPKQRNEDALGIQIPDALLLPTKGIVACIADGVSAASAGKEAAEAAVIGFITDYYETPEAWEVKTAGQRVLTALNRWLFAQGQGHRHAEKGWLTTFTALVLKSRTAHVFHIGDSRLYQWRGDRLELITRDHSARLSAETCYLTRALGLTLTPRIDYHTFPLETGDRFLLTTDGIHDEIPDDAMRALLTEQQDIQSCANALGQAASYSRDNRSCIVLRVDALPDGNKDDVFRELSTLPFPPDLLPGQSIDRLRVEKILSSSKNSQVYLVHDLENNERPLVLKAPSVLFNDDPSYLERFALEEWIGLRMNHPNLVKAIRRPHPRRFLYHLMEPVAGATLSCWVKANPRPSVEQVVAILSRIVDGVRALHRKDTLHQDLKPDNILIDSNDEVKIIDYGSCRVGGVVEMSTPFDRASALGTLDFSAPEYRLGQKPGPRSDLFSIALLGYFMLTGGQSPFGPAWERAKVPRDFLRLQYRPSGLHHPMVPPWMDQVLKKTLSMRPELRPSSMSEFIEYLKKPEVEFLQREALSFAERNPLLFWKVISLLLLTGWIITWLALR